MATYRVLNQAPQYLLPSGKVNAGGSLTFYETNLTDEKNTWSDPAKTTLNSNPVTLDAAGRTVTDVWGDGEYGVVMKDALGAMSWTRNNVQPGDGTSATALPTLGEGQFISSDGTTLIAVDILQLPDMTGEAGNILYTDGTLAFWDAPPATPEVPEPDIVVSSTSFLAGNSDSTTKFFMQRGTATAPATGALSSSVAVAFPEEFDALWTVIPTITVAGVSSLSPPGQPSWGVTGFTPGAASAGVTVNFRIATDSGDGPSNMINNPVPFAWVAIGTKTVAP